MESTVHLSGTTNDLEEAETDETTELHSSESIGEEEKNLIGLTGGGESKGSEWRLLDGVGWTVGDKTSVEAPGSDAPGMKSESERIADPPLFI